MYNSPFLAVQCSFWPLLISLTLWSLVINTILFININLSVVFVLTSTAALSFVVFLWWNDFTRESMLGYHTHKLEVSLRVGMLLFILSEVFFFLSFFWAFYDSSLSPSVDIGMSWPPAGIQSLSVYSVPLLNTVILLSSGVTVTWAHHSIVSNSFTNSFTSLFFTVSLGVYFLFIQWVEYCELQFTMADSVYGSVFFISTGFHGMHVLAGSVFLLVALVHLALGKLLSLHHFSFEAAAWYWHFVDVVWLVLFLSIYWWGSL